MGLYEYLWEHGFWDPDIENQVASRVLPNVSHHLALNASRVPRPDWPPANEAEDQLGDIVRVSDADPTYSRWVRLALHEQQFFQSDSRDYLPPDKSAMISAAVVHTELDGTVPARSIPLPPGEVSSCWDDISAREAMIDARRPQLVQIGWITDWLGKGVALIPPLVLRLRARLQPPVYGAPLRWRDLDGKPAIVFRNWQVRGRGSETERHVTFGCDLLMRPDLLEILERAYGGGPFKELQWVRKHDVEEL